ncbi:MAG: alpha/beta hydrolase family protein [Candidatus Eiseniibacteriota bacterium]
MVRTQDGQTLAGTLTLPNASGRYAAVLLISSADAQNRDASNVHDYYHPFRQLADTLTRAGLAVLRLDDRGVGKSTGRLDTLDTRARAQDARDALAFMRARRDLRSDRLALLGHSEGALIAGMIAGEDTTLHGLVLMASTGRTGRATVEWLNHRALAHTRAEGRERNAMFHSAMEAWDERVREDAWAAFFDTYDPTVVMHHVRAPLLILHGEQDANCPPSDAYNLGDAAKSSGNLDVTVRTLAGLDHAFLRVGDFKDGVASGDSAYLLSRELLGSISSWLTQHLK